MSSPLKKCKSIEDCKQVKCSGAERLYPVCRAGDVCTCFETAYDRPCYTNNDCLMAYNSTCSVCTSYCDCIEIGHPKNNNNNAKEYDSNNNYLSNKTMGRKFGVEIGNGKCNIISCEFMCVSDPDMIPEYSVTGGCTCNPLFA